MGACDVCGCTTRDRGACAGCGTPVATTSTIAPAATPLPVSGGGSSPRWSAATPMGAADGPYAPPPAPRPEVTRFAALTPEQRYPTVRVKRRAKLRVVVYAVVVGLLGAGGLYGYRTINETNDAVPSPIAFVRGAGVAYAPAGQGYRIRLPEKPTHVASHTTTDHKLAVHESDLRYDHYDISIASYDLPARVSPAAVDFDMRALLSIWAGKATKIVKVSPAVDRGRPALEAVGRVPDRYPVRVHVVLGTHHLVLVAVHADNGNASVYRALVKSLRLG